MSKDELIDEILKRVLKKISERENQHENMPTLPKLLVIANPECTKEIACEYLAVIEMYSVRILRFTVLANIKTI